VIRAVLDTNVLASGLISEEGTLSTLLDCWAAGMFTVVTSEHILTELESMLAKPYFQRGASADWVARTIERIRAGSDIARITVVAEGIATHPENDLVLATAVSGDAEYLVTGDRQLLKVKEFRGICIVGVAEFLANLADSQDWIGPH
jgi:uncharacterized protein